MSITDELREWKRKLNTRFTPEVVLTMRCEINCIADRIDAALEGYIELPKDADGQTIHVGDMLDGYRRRIHVKELRNAGTWHLVDEFGNEWHDHEAFTHVQPDSWESIIEDAMEAYQFDDGSSEPSVGSLVERCKRLAGENA